MQEIKKKTVVVTGGAGFIGSALVRYLIAYTEYRVVTIDALTYAGNLKSLGAVIEHPRHVFLKIDIADCPAVIQVLHKYQPEIVFHLAAETHVDRSIDGPDVFVQTNVVGTVLLLRSVLEYWRMLTNFNREKFRFIHVSTDEVYGSLCGDDSPFSEYSCYKPNSPYSASKAASDHFARAWYKTYDLPTIITNCSNNYGPFQFPEKLIPLMILNAFKGHKLPVYGDGMQIRDWLYVEDHVRALALVAQKGKPGETYNIGGCEERTNIELIHLICELLDEFVGLSNCKINRHAELISHVVDRPGHDRRYAVDISKIKNHLGWVPQESLQTGLRKTVQWYLENFTWGQV